MDLKITPSGQTIVKPTALGPGANTNTKLLIYGLFQKGRVLAQDGLLDRRYAALVAQLVAVAALVPSALIFFPNHFPPDAQLHAMQTSWLSGFDMTDDSSFHWRTKPGHLQSETSPRAGLKFVCIFGHDASEVGKTSITVFSVDKSGSAQTGVAILLVAARVGSNVPILEVR